MTINRVWTHATTYWQTNYVIDIYHCEPKENAEGWHTRMIAAVVGPFSEQLE